MTVIFLYNKETFNILFMIENSDDDMRIEILINNVLIIFRHISD